MHASPMLTPILLGVLAGDAEKGRGVRSSSAFRLSLTGGDPEYVAYRAHKEALETGFRGPRLLE